MKEEFEIRAMGFGELAQMYCPNVSPSSARNTLRNWIKRNQGLENELGKLGYRKGYHTLTPIQVGTIVSHLGFP